MKKIASILLCGIMILGLVGCGGSTTPKPKDTESNSSAATEKKEKAKEQSPVTIEELPLEVTILEPDSIGIRYIEATFTNNSKYAIKGFSVTILLKDKNEKVYLNNYDTVMPGETSPKFKAFGPETGNKEDMEYLNYDITLVKEDGTTVYIEYDAKLKTYKWM
jgi:hypothetical protein